MKPSWPFGFLQSLTERLFHSIQSKPDCFPLIFKGMKESPESRLIFDNSSDLPFEPITFKEATPAFSAFILAVKYPVPGFGNSPDSLSQNSH